MKLNIQGQLIANGHLMRDYQLKGKSISSVDRRVIMRIRREAAEAGLSQRTINSFEMWGMEGKPRATGRLIDAEFIGFQDVCRVGIKMRLYNVAGFHPLAGSTVGVMTLIHLGVAPRDIGFGRIGFEYLKEVFLGLWDLVDQARFKISELRGN